MKILIVHPSFYVYGGAELLIVRLCNYLSRQQIENAILTTAMLPEIRSDFHCTKIYIEKNRFKVKRGRAEKPGQILALLRGIYKLKGRYDIINVHNFPANLIAPFCSESVVWMCNEPQVYLVKKNAKSIFDKALGESFLFFEKFIIRRCIDKIIVSDRFNARRFKIIYNVNSDIVNYGIDHQYFVHNDADKRALENIKGDKFAILQVGLFTPYKNQLASIKTIKKLKDKISDLKLILAGYWDDKLYKSKIDDYIRANDLEQFVILTGHLDRNELRNYYHACDVLIHPIRSQGGWLAPFEALSAGKPIIVSPRMTAAEIIKKKKSGL